MIYIFVWFWSMSVETMEIYSSETYGSPKEFCKKWNEVDDSQTTLWKAGYLVSISSGEPRVLRIKCTVTEARVEEIR